jgi:hypothetical protein
VKIAARAKEVGITKELIRRAGKLFMPFKAAVGTPCPIEPCLAGAGLDTVGTGRLLSISMHLRRVKLIS